MEISQFLALVGVIAVTATISILTIATLTLLSALVATASARTHSIHEIDEDVTSGSVRYKVRFPPAFTGRLQSFFLRFARYVPAFLLLTYFILFSSFLALPAAMIRYDGVFIVSPPLSVDCVTGEPAGPSESIESMDLCTVRTSEIQFRRDHSMPSWVRSVLSLKALPLYLVAASISYTGVVVLIGVLSRLLLSAAKNTPVRRDFTILLKNGNINSA